MPKLVKPSDYAIDNGFSRQAIYAKIKNGTLPSKKVEGKLFVVVEQETDSVPQESSEVEHLKDIIDSKNETIAILQKSIEDLKTSNEGVIDTLQSEIELLKQAFAEMKGIYREAIPHQAEQPRWQSIKKYCKAKGIKADKSFTKKVKKLYKNGDKRVKKEKGKLYIAGEIYGD